jgi:hypothetical protein
MCENLSMKIWLNIQKLINMLHDINRLNDTILSIGSENAFSKIQQSLC